ncbi:PREDICTED: class A basic helix-loop-helix protein 15-like [Dinoponera quadriceps]|uniref:Class A basic helix-loop-helix protein 15-like n=1 Tax=Dinoponera quadriceps TaxID=609295 RepID=A0A6P3XPI1_DINQU|nr:PREDICTED: class A basic helix-loop-helix protein 15-like [Dinoponera quadriceps]
MRSKVTNEDTWESKWAAESPPRGRGVRRAARRTEPSGLKLSKPGRRDTARERTLRRLESNQRERMRMHSLNDAFQSLREVIPHVTKERRLSKIETLTLAKNYIVALTDVICAMTSVSEGRAGSDNERLEAVRVDIANSRTCGCSETPNFYSPSEHSRWEDDRNNCTGL